MATARLIQARSPYLADYVFNVPCRNGVTVTAMYLLVGRVLLHSTRYHVGKLSHRCDTLCAMGNAVFPPIITARRAA